MVNLNFQAIIINNRNANDIYFFNLTFCNQDQDRDLFFDHKGFSTFFNMLQKVNPFFIWESFKLRPFEFLAAKRLGGWSQKMAIFADVQHYLC